MLSKLMSALGLGRRPDHLFIACMPKSGSTYLHAVLREITGCPDGYVSEWGEQNEGDVCERRLRRLRRRSVIQQHTRATSTNLKWMLAYGVRPIVQTRSLFDVVPSLHDHLEKGQGGLTCGHVDRSFWSRNWNDRMEYLIHLYIPWYLNFLVSWREAMNEIEMCPISYEELFADQLESLTRVVDFYGLPATEQDITAAIERASHRNTRFNVGVSGRGSEKLTIRHKQTIRNLAAMCGFDVSETGSVVAPFAAPHLSAESPQATIPMRKAA